MTSDNNKAPAAESPHLVPVKLTFHTASASRVAVRGSWNNWASDTLLFKQPQRNDHCWSVVLHLKSGPIQFRFICDWNQWITAPNYDSMSNGHGETNNSLVVVAQSPADNTASITDAQIETKILSTVSSASTCTEIDDDEQDENNEQQQQQQQNEQCSVDTDTAVACTAENIESTSSNTPETTTTTESTVSSTQAGYDQNRATRSEDMSSQSSSFAAGSASTLASSSSVSSSSSKSPPGVSGEQGVKARGDAEPQGDTSSGESKDAEETIVQQQESESGTAETKETETETETETERKKKGQDKDKNRNGGPQKVDNLINCVVC